MVSPEERAALGGYDQPTDETDDSDSTTGGGSGSGSRSDTDSTGATSDERDILAGGSGSGGGSDAPTADDINRTISETTGGHGLGGSPAGGGGGRDLTGGAAGPAGPDGGGGVQPGGGPSDGGDDTASGQTGGATPAGKQTPGDTGVGDAPGGQGIEDMTATTGGLVMGPGGLTTERDLARRLEQQVVDNDPSLTKDDVAIVRRGDRFVPQPLVGTEETDIRIDRQLERVVGRKRAQSLGISPSLLDDESTRKLADLERGEDYTIDEKETGGSAQLTPETREDLQREFAEREIETQVGLEQGTFVNLDPQQDIRVGAGWTGLTRSGAEKVVEPALEAGVGRARAQSLGISPALFDNTGRLADLERGQDFTVDIGQGSQQASVAATLSPVYIEGLRREFATRAFEAETGVGLDPDQDIGFTVNEEGRSVATLTRAGEVNVMANAPEGYGDATIRDAGDIPVIGGAVDWWAEQFGREPYGVSDLPTGISLGTETVERRRAGPGPQRTAEAERVTGVDVQTFEEGTTVEEALSAASLEYSDAVDSVAKWNVKYNPAARFAISEFERVGFGDEAETVIESAVRGAGELTNIPQLGLTVKEAGEAVPYAAEETAGGRLGISYDPARVGETPSGQSVAAPLTVEETGLAPRAASDVKSAAIGTYEYARENPFEFGGAAAGSLIASAAIMGGAGAISSRAGLASRAVIQPGEELLGYGGNFLTRRVAGERTAQRLFPNNEPLIFSEEAAIRGARRSVASARRGVDRLRTEVEGVDVTVRPRPGVGLGGFAIEVERAKETEQPEELGPELDPFDVSDTRLYDPSRSFGETDPIERFIDEPTGELPQDIGSGIGPRGEAGGFRGGSVQENWEAYLEGERARAETAQESFIQLESRRRAETAAVLSGQEVEGLGVETSALERIGLDVESRQETETFSELFADLEFDAEQRSGYESEAEGESAFELELEAEAEAEFFREFETEVEQEQEQEVEVEILGGGDRERDPATGLGFEASADESVISRATGPGWLNVYAVALAGGDLEARGAADEDFVGALPAPTRGQVDPDEELAAGLAAVDEFFFGGSRSGGGESGSSSDEDPWGLTF